MDSARAGSPFEAVLVGVGGAVLGFLTGLAVDQLLDTSFVAWVAAVIAAASAAISGWRGVYDWRRPDGVVAYVLDSTWSLLMTTAGLVANVVGLASKDADYLADLSVRQNVHVYRHGLMPREGFAITLGNVISGAGEVERTSRRQLITDHEVVHVWQARWFGPLYPLFYGVWSGLAALYGIVMWLTRHRDRRFGKVVETYAYYCNPVEWWAYSRAGKWRPSKMVDRCGWKKAMVRPLARVSSRTTAD